ncbi:MAG TPA: hypothetical protein PKA41_06190 [Verrucomicrobiota bacterium]|mgnify:CR=1 FL=1|nr:hypothetical protein [Verrucomicrobiota bacterium]
MKLLLPLLLTAVCLVAGCASPPAQTEFQSVPAPSNVSPALSQMAAPPPAPEQPATKQSKPPKSPKETKTSKQSSTEPASPVITPEPVRSGKVMTYNHAGRFVVLNFSLDSVPAIGERVFIYRNELKIGEARITGPRREDNIVADLVAGDAATGDEVRFK